MLTTSDADIGQVAYEMAILVQRTGDHLQVNMRDSLPPYFRQAEEQELMPSNDERWLYAGGLSGCPAEGPDEGPHADTPERPSTWSPR